MSKKPELPMPVKKSSLEHLSTAQLKTILRSLESENTIMQAKNQELTSHITDLRDVVKHVEQQRSDELGYLLDKKKKLLNQIQRSEAALKVANKKDNNMYSDMLGFKSLHQKN